MRTSHQRLVDVSSSQSGSCISFFLSRPVIMIAVNTASGVSAAHKTQEIHKTHKTHKTHETQETHKTHKRFTNPLEDSHYSHDSWDS